MANLKDLIVNGASRFIGKVFINDSQITKINGSTVGQNPKFTDTNTTYSAGTGLTASGTTINHATSITAASVGPSADISGSTVAVPYITYNATGHITAASTKKYTVGSLAASAITSGTLATSILPTIPIAKGGTGNTTGNAASATKLANARTIRTNLASTATANFNGTANVTPGVQGVLPIANGGTGSSTAAAARTALGLGSAAVATTSASVGNNTNLPTGAAIQTYVTGLGYEANQNAFTTVKVGTTDLVADTKTDTLTITAGNNITLTPTASSDSFSIAATNTTYGNATSSAAGLMSAEDKQTLDGLIVSGGEVNQNAFSNVVVGSSTVAADQKTDTLTLVGSGSVSISADTSTDTITITGTNTTYGAATTATAGLMAASDKIKLNGVPTSVFKTIKVGTTNLIADNAEDTLTITAGDNITLTPTASSDSFSIAATNTTYAVATTSADGLMSAADKIKIDKTIHQLSTLSTVSADDQIAIYNVASSATGKSTLENMLTNIDINISEIGLQDNTYALSSIADSTRIYMNIRGTDANAEENNVNLTIPMSGTGTTAGWFHAKAAVIQKKMNGEDYVLVGAFPLADTTNGFILDENVMDSTTIAAWEAIL